MKKLYKALAARWPILKSQFYVLLTNLGLWKNLQWDNVQVFFIISTGRTGTKFLASLFNQFEHVIAFHEPRPHFLKLGNDFAAGKISSQKAMNKIERGRRITLKELKRQDPKIKVYVEANNRLFSLIPVLLTNFKGCKIIHIVRDGRDVIRSEMNRFENRRHPFPRLKATDFPADPYYEKWNDMSKFERVCWWWQKKDKIIYEAVKKRKNCVTIRFEDIFNEKSGYPGMKKIIDFINMDFDGHTELLNYNLILNSQTMNKKVNKPTDKNVPHWKHWDQNQIKQFKMIAGEHMKKYGYIDKDTNW